MRILRLFVLLPLVLAQDVPHTRDFFFVGGEFVDTTSDPFVPEGKMLAGQVYVERLKPVSPSKKKYPIVLIHGHGQIGTNWLNKPDGGEGWASQYLGAGHTVYIVDQVNRGRSPTAPGLPQEVWAAERVEFAFTATHLHNIWPHSNLHSQWPGTGLLGDSIFEAYYATVTPSNPDFGIQEDRMREPMRQLAEKVDEESILLTHSQGGFLGWVMADIVGRKRIRAIVSIEPVGPTFEETRMLGIENPKPRLWGITNTSLTFDPPVTDPKVDFKIKRDGELPFGCLLQDDAYPIRKLKHLADIPILVVTAEASFSRHWDPCTVAFLRQAGVQVEWIKLWEHGIKGNGHMMFLEKNSGEIWKLINGWISRLGENQEGGKGPDIAHNEL